MRVLHDDELRRLHPDDDDVIDVLMMDDGEVIF
jgi:hypothetical protein